VVLLVSQNLSSLLGQAIFTDLTRSHTRTMTDAVTVTAYHPDDREAVLALAPRLSVGVAPWRPAEGVRSAVRTWFEESIDAAGEEHPVFVARLAGEVVGMVAVEEQRHWSGDPDAYVGELATAEGHEGHGVGRALLTRAETWARDRGLTRITLETGAANDRARAFYSARGYRDEEIRLTRVLA
jgi:ribosomal protein S18 acetylase RimI-like enzyme